MILLAEHDEPSLAAKKKQQHVASETATSTPKNRVWGFENYQPGQNINEPVLSAETATGSVQFSYEIASGQAYYYSFDHLNSVREMTNSSGTIVARYDYDPFGRTTLVSGTNLATFQYAEMQMHQPSGLYLTSLGNTYDPTVGRWIGRDSLGEGVSLNLYRYSDNDPIDEYDPWGLSPGTPNGGHWHPGPSKPDNTPYGYVLGGFMVVPVVAVGSIPELGVAVAARLGLGALAVAEGGTAAANAMNGQSSTCPVMTEAQAAASALGKGPLANPGAPLTPQMIQALKNNLAAAQNNLNQAAQGLNRAGNPIDPARAATVTASAQARINEINAVLNSGVQAPKN